MSQTNPILRRKEIYDEIERLLRNEMEVNFGKIQINERGYIKAEIKVSYQNSHIDIFLCESRTYTYLTTTDGIFVDNCGIIEKLCFEKNLETTEPLEFNEIFKLVVCYLSSEYFKETKYYKMRCLYNDEEFKNKFD